MTHEEMVQAVGEALDLEKKVSSAQGVYSNLNSQVYPELSVEPPTKGTIKPEKYPTIKSNVKLNYISLLAIPGGIASVGIIVLIVAFVLFSSGKSGTVIVGVLLGIVGFVIMCGAAAVSLIYLFKKYMPEKDADIAKIKASEAYKEQCRLVDERNAQAVAESEMEYGAKMAEYENDIVPKYNAEKAEWEGKHFLEVNKARENLDNVSARLKEHYESTKIIPAKYHDIASLEYIYNIVSTSEYDFKEAAAELERERTNNIELQRVYAQQEQNALLEEQNNIAEKARRDANMQAFVGAIQSHNRNKSLNSISDSLKNR